ncbi:MAG: hypothetical protein HY560_08740 [Gemmatimonadetes bacterium]|nr:hypothetical protein [Gemmatimonadota bacterium]
MRGWTAQRNRGTLWALLLASVGSFGPATQACARSNTHGNPGFSPREEAQLAPDSTVVIIRITNPQAFPVSVFLETPYGPLRIGVVSGQRSSIFVLPTATVSSITQFAVAVIPDGHRTRGYRTGTITRTPGQMTFVAIVVGEDAGGAGAKNGMRT